MLAFGIEGMALAAFFAAGIYAAALHRQWKRAYAARAVEAP
jgi:hypothetical protein